MRFPRSQSEINEIPKKSMRLNEIQKEPIEINNIPKKSMSNQCGMNKHPMRIPPSTFRSPLETFPKPIGGSFQNQWWTHSKSLGGHFKIDAEHEESKKHQ